MSVAAPPPSTAGLPLNGQAGPARSPASAPTARGTERLPHPARRRRPGVAALGVALVIGCSAISASIVLASGRTVAVLTVTRRVPPGQAVTSGDLGTAMISGSGVTAVATSDRDQVVGQVAEVDLLPGTLLSADMITRRPVPAPGEAVVGLSLKPGLLPEAELRAGSMVMLVRLPAPQTSAVDSRPGEDVLVPRARVLSETTDRTTGGRLVSLLVNEHAAPEVSRAAASGTVSVVVIGSKP